MRRVWLRVFGFFLEITVVCLFFMVIQQGFPCFEYTRFPVDETLVQVESEIGREVSHALWAWRQLDMIALAFLLFVTAACCSTVLRPERDEQS